MVVMQAGRRPQYVATITNNVLNGASWRLGSQGDRLSMTLRMLKTCRMGGNLQAANPCCGLWKLMGSGPGDGRTKRGFQAGALLNLREVTESGFQPRFDGA